ncbi:type I polyketide synthase [Arhodomonas sp. AD133]|uniref:type I polyketide synthase n=1 Tax=Arhodomonas sp. AD133 TaxID=3415009 RepID=UPI003EBEDD49
MSDSNDGHSNAELKRSLGRAVATIRDLRTRMENVERRAREPVAVIGMGCRFPGGADNPKRFWRLLRDGVDAITDFPRDRLHGTDYYDADPQTPGKAYVMRGGFIDEVDRFDPTLFGISPREAVGMDPQQRLALEVSWEALESAGLAPDRLQGSRTGVYMGVSTNDYVRLRQQLGDPADVDAYQFYGEVSFIPGRIAYTYGFHGPAELVDTSCSSSLVAMHQACRSLRSGETDLALAGGVNLILSPYGFVLVSKLRAVSPDGRCKTFDSSADGYGRGEGCGILVLKRLSDAQADGDPILGVVQGSAINHDGPSSGITVPNAHAQQAVVSAALDDGGIEPHQVSYVEAHGTGTDLGDPIELRALDAVLGTASGRDDPLTVGSVKTNIGHLEPAAGVAGVMKVILGMQHGHIPPHLHLQHPNPRVEWDRLAVRVPRDGMAWESDGARRYAGVSSFGVSGTNAHVLIAEAPERERPQRRAERPWQVLTLSGCDQAARRQVAGRYERHIVEQEPDLADVCYSANVSRAPLEYRFAAVADSADTLRGQLAAYAARKLADDVVEGCVPRGSRPQVVFLFTGQGAQYVGMGRELYDTEPVFRAAFDRCSEILASTLDVALTDLIYPRVGPGDEATLQQTRYTQPALFAFEYALAQLWLAWGVRPAALLGHSVGEIVAACVAGALPLEDALRLVAARGELMQELPAGGAMVAVNATEAEVQAALAGYERVSIAAVNGVEDVVVSGDHEGIDAVVSAFEEQGVATTPLRVSHAFHSAAMDPVLEPLRAVAAELDYREPRIPVVANVTGQFHTGASLADPDYWARHAREAVRFADGLETLAEAQMDIALEVGPAPVLTALGRRGPGAEQRHWIASMRRDGSSARGMRLAVANLFVSGVSPDWNGVHEGDGAVRLPLPTYAFQRERYWFELARDAASPAASGVRGEAAGELLGRRLEMPVPAFESVLDEAGLAELGGLSVDDARVLPDSGALWLPFQAGQDVAGPGDYHLSDLTMGEPIAVRRNDRVTVYTLMQPRGAGEWLVQCYQRTGAEAVVDGSWRQVLSATLSRVAAGARADSERGDGQRLHERCPEIGEVDAGLVARGIAAVRRGEGGECLCIIDEDQHHGASGVPLAAALAAALGQGEHVRISHVDHAMMTHRDPDALAYVHVTGMRAAPGGGTSMDVALYDGEGGLLGRLTRVTVDSRADAQLTADAVPLPDLYYALDWEEQIRRAEPRERPGRALVFADRDGHAQALVQGLEADGWQCRVVGADESEALDCDAVAAAVRDAVADEFSHILFLRGLDLPGPADTTVEALAACRGDGTEPVVRIVQTLAAERPAREPKLWIATCGAQPAGDRARALQVAGGPLWGLGKVIALEHPEYWGGLVDLDPADSSPCRDLVEELRHPGEEDQLAFRGARRYVQRLNPWAGASLPCRPFAPGAEGWYLITGGLGGVGLALARWLAANGAGGIAITGRRALSDGDEGARALRAIEAEGARVRYFQADVTAMADMAHVVDTLAAEPGGLRGVVHAAGVSLPQDLVDVDTERFDTVLRPKVEGAWVLHELTASLELEFFALFSSIACVWGSQHIASYAAANQFLDGLAHHRRALGLPAMVADWGLWGIGSHLFDDEVATFLKSVGLKPLPGTQGIDVLVRLLASDITQIVVAGVDWETFKPLLESRGPRPLLRGIRTDERRRAEPYAESDILQRLAAAEADERLAVMDGYVWDQYARILGVDVERVKAKLEDGGSLMDFGLDSLMVMEMIGRCRRDLRIEINARDFFDCPGLQWPDFLLEQVNTQHGDVESLAASA